MLATLLSVDDLVARIPDGAKLALPPDYSYCALAAVRALIRRGARDLHLVGVPSIGFQADMMIGAGCAATIETAAVTLSEYGLAPRFTAAVKEASIRMMDATCPAIHAGLQASEKGIPFIPLRGLIGSDILRQRADWKIGKNPFAENMTFIYPTFSRKISFFEELMFWAPTRFEDPAVPRGLESGARATYDTTSGKGS